MGKQNVPVSDERVRQIIENVKATLAIEGLCPSDKVVEIGKRHLMGELSEKEALKEIDQFIKDAYGIGVE